MTRLLVAWSAVSMILLDLSLAEPAYADHESRDRILSQSGIEIILIVLVLIAAVAAMAAFAAIILWWERKDEDADRHDESG